MSSHHLPARRRTGPSASSLALTLALTLAATAPLAGCGDDVLPPLPGNDAAAATMDMGGGGGGCSDDKQCAGDTPRCDRNTSRCVRCLPQNDNCPAGQRCVGSGNGYACAGTCGQSADCPRTDGGVALLCCSGACLDTTSDSQNCGACGKACPAPPNASAACTAGACGQGACNLGYADCDGDPQNGCETLVATDVKNCGRCGAACAGGPNQSATCAAGSCTIACSPGFADCDGNAGNGCETNSGTDPLNCGACGKRCAGLPNASSACNGGVCVIVSCVPGRTDCNLRPDDGCEADLATDPLNCGACGTACPAVPNGSSGCAKGQCAVGACDKGFGDCDGLLATGCETKVGGDPKNCGACGVVCAGPNSSQVCKGGLCAVSACNPGFSDCDGKPETGCESNTASDVANCGGCGKACAPIANANVACAGSSCTYAGCKFGFEDCNGDVKDGCEANLLGPMNCGKCGNVCPAPPNAMAGCNLAVCGVGACLPGWGDCNKLPGDGCEKPVDSDVANCGACGRVCALPNAIPGCLGGQCGVLGCNPGWADCDGNPANGCELYVNGDVKNCGKCGNACGNGLQCSGGQCLMLYQPVGPQQNVPIGNLTGWSQCFLDVYGDGMLPSLAQIQAACSKSKLLLACRPTGAATLQLLAWAPRADVFFDCGNAYDNTTSHSANGSAWYFSSALSWGFAKDGDPVKRGSCDYRASSIDATGGNGALRLCWHTAASNLSGGWRCGTNDTLNASQLFERIIYQAD